MDLVFVIFTFIILPTFSFTTISPLQLGLSPNLNRWEALKYWANREFDQVFVHSSLGYKSSSKSIVALENIQKDTVVLVLPSSLFMDAKTCFPHFYSCFFGVLSSSPICALLEIFPNCRDNNEKCRDPFLLLCLYLHRHILVDSPFGLYMNYILPKKAVTGYYFDHHFFQDLPAVYRVNKNIQNEFNESFSVMWSHLEILLKFLYEHTRIFYTSKIRNINDLTGMMKNRASIYNDCKELISLYSSRYFYVPTRLSIEKYTTTIDRFTLVPFLDMFNHPYDVRESLYFEIHQGDEPRDDVVVMMTPRYIHKYEELHVSYGPTISNDRLFAQYGFTFGNNEADRVFLPNPIKSALAQMKEGCKKNIITSATVTMPSLRQRFPYGKNTCAVTTQWKANIIKLFAPWGDFEIGFKGIPLSRWNGLQRGLRVAFLDIEEMSSYQILQVLRDKQISLKNDIIVQNHMFDICSDYLDQMTKNMEVYSKQDFFQREFSSTWPEEWTYIFDGIVNIMTSDIKITENCMQLLAPAKRNYLRYLALKY